jgi:dipeptidase D
MPTLLERLGGRAAITRGILQQFRALSQFPHPTHGEKRLGDYLQQRLEMRGLDTARDEAGNLLCLVGAVPGRESAPTLILQGHLDMVCAWKAGSSFDPVRDPVTVEERDGFLCSDGKTSLGADNCLGNAAVLWLLEQNVHHGPLRLLFTVAEEVGLEGAKQVDPTWLKGAEYLLNTDGFHLGRAIVGSAGGRRETYSRALDTAPPRAGRPWRLELSGCTGGHSGDDIHRGRANPIKLLAHFLRDLTCTVDYQIASLEGGTGHNVIPTWAGAVLLCRPEEEELLRQAAQRFYTRIRAQYAATDPNLEWKLEPAPAVTEVWTASLRDGVLGLLNQLFDGVYTMHPAFPKVVGASANVGRVYVEQGEIRVCAFVRCARREEEEKLVGHHDSTAARAGFSVQAAGYPGWPGTGENALAQQMDRVFRAQVGRPLEVSAVHVGLEPSIFQEKQPGLTMVSTGPEILDAHSVHERAPLAGLPDYALLLAGTMEAI